MNKYRAPLTSRDNHEILTLLEDGAKLEDIVEPKLVQPIKSWRQQCDRYS